MKNLLKRIDSMSIRMLLSYFSILLVPLCVVLVIYNTAMDAILVSRQETALNALKETAVIMTARIEELNNIGSYIYTDYNTNAIINRSRFETKSRNIYAFYQTMGTLPNYKLFNQMIDDVYILFNEAEFVIKLPNAFAFTEYNYDQHIRFHGISYEEIRALSGSRYVGGLLVRSDEGGQDVLLLRSIPNTQYPAGLIVIELNTDTIESIMATNETGPGGGAYIINREGSVLSRTGDAAFDEAYLAGLVGQESPSYREIVYEGERYLLCLVEEANLTYATLTGKEHLLSSIAPIRLLITVMSAGAFVLGGLICVLLWRRRRRVVKHIESTARSAGVDIAPVKNETDLLESTVDTLVSKMDTLRETMDRQRDALGQTVVQGCLLGTFPSRADMLREVSAMELNLLAARYHVVRVLLLDPWEIKEESAQILPYRVFLKEFFAEHLPITHVVSDIDGASFAILLAEGEAYTTAALTALFRGLSEQVGQRDWVVPSFAISGSRDDLWEVSALYRQTEEIAGYMALLERRGVFSDADLPKTTDTMYFPMELEIRLIQTMKTGTREAVEALFDRIIDENRSKRMLNAAMLKALFEALRRAILRAIQEEGDEPDSSAIVEALASVKSFADLRGYAVRTQELLSRASEEQDREENQQVKESLRRHIDESLSNPGFNLYMLSELAGIPEATLYRTFKDYFGVSFSGYLEQRRINKAFELLKNQVMIKDVAEQVGYISDHTFRRAFKRVMKVPPSQFAKLTQRH